MNKKRLKLGEFSNIYKGMVWASFPMKVVWYVLDYIKKNPHFLSDLKHTVVPEEFFFQTIIMNSRFSGNVVNRNLRYTDWAGRNGSNPSYLDESDYSKIIQSNSFFARKIDMDISAGLIENFQKGEQNFCDRICDI